MRTRQSLRTETEDQADHYDRGRIWRGHLAYHRFNSILLLRAQEEEEKRQKTWRQN